jgi:hypothetical protein
MYLLSPVGNIMKLVSLEFNENFFALKHLFDLVKLSNPRYEQQVDAKNIVL